MNNKENQNIAVWALTEKGLAVACACAEKINAAGLLAPAGRKITAKGMECISFDSLHQAVTRAFNTYDGHVFVMAAGIVVRTIAPLLKDKTSDPAVVVVDEAACHAVSLVSGHLGGANALCLQVAAALDADPVVTTATDTRGILAMDEMARRIGATVENKATIKLVSTAMLCGQPVALVCEKEIYSRFYQNADNAPAHMCDPTDGDLEPYAAVCVVSEKVYDLPLDMAGKTLLIRPANLVAGIGCNKNTQAREIRDAVEKVFADHHLSMLSVAEFATVEDKKAETGLVSFARSFGKELVWFSADVLNEVDAPNMSPPSVYAQTHIGARGVAEPAALKAAGKSAHLVVPKQKIGNVTVAVAKKAVDLSCGTLFVVGIGPGDAAHMTGQARQMIRQSDVIAGYGKYIDLVADLSEGKATLSTGMTKETQRVDAAIAAAAAGKTVSLVCSGDAGIYGMAGLVYERMDILGADFEVAVTPGITAAASAASLVGAPLTNDFITLSLSDLLTPKKTVEQRIETAAASNMVTVIYNPVSKKRTTLIRLLRERFLSQRDKTTPVGVVTHALRPGQEIFVSTLADFLDCPMNMNSAVIIGNSDTTIINGRMVTRRGYEKKCNCSGI